MCDGATRRWRLQAFCHANDKVALIKQAYDALNPGGILMFSDIMMSDAASEEDVINFTKTNAGKVRFDRKHDPVAVAAPPPRPARRSG